MLSPITSDTIVTSLVFIPKICENVLEDLNRSFDNVIRALGELQVETQECDYKVLIYRGRLTTEDIQLLNKDYCASSIVIMGITGQYKYFTKSDKCELVLRPLDE
jgi:hypothetical protein